MKTTTTSREPLNYWAIRVNSSVVELRVVRGPAKVKISRFTKKVTYKENDNDGGCDCAQCSSSITREKVIKYQHTTFLNGRVIGYYSHALCQTSQLHLLMGTKDAIKLTKEQIALVRNADWRENNL